MGPPGARVDDKLAVLRDHQWAYEALDMRTPAWVYVLKVWILEGRL